MSSSAAPFETSPDEQTCVRMMREHNVDSKKLGKLLDQSVDQASKPISAVNDGFSGPVKKSRSGICHAPGSTYYARTLNFKPFTTIDSCLTSGGRLPKR